MAPTGPWIEIADVTANEGDGSVTFNATLHGNTDPFVLYYRSLDGSALGLPPALPSTATQDFSGEPAEKSIQFFGTDGEAHTISFTLIDDAIAEIAEESMTLELLRATNVFDGNPSIVAIPRQQATGTIIDDDAVRIGFTENGPVAELNPGDPAPTIVVTAWLTGSTSLQGTTDTDVTIHFHVEDKSYSGALTAEDGTDFLISVSQLTIPAGQRTASLTVAVTPDHIVEDVDQTFNVVFDGITLGDGAPRDIAFEGDVSSISVPLGIKDDDSATVYIVESGVHIHEGGIDFDGLPELTRRDFTVRLSAEVDVPFSVDVGTLSYSGPTPFGTTGATSSQSTLGEADYSHQLETLEFTGVAFETQTFSVFIYGDRTVELDEVFDVKVHNVFALNRLVSAGGSEVVVIENDDIVHISISNASVSEGDPYIATFAYMYFAVTLDRPMPVDVTVTFALTDGTAVAGQDYHLLNFTVLPGI